MALEPVLKDRGFKVSLMLGDGKPLTKARAEISATILSANLVLLGMSAPAENAELEVFAAGVARENRVPYGFYGDVPNCWNIRTQEGMPLTDLAPGASFYFGISESDANTAKEVFSEGSMFGTGNPLREEAAFPKFSREEVREKLGVKDDEKLILAPGGRFPGGLDTTGWAIIMEALCRLSETDGMKFQLVMTPHPGDRVAFAVDPANSQPLNIYDGLVENSPVPARIVYRDEMRTSEILPGADLVVEFGSSVGVEAAYLGIPDVTLAFEPLLRYWQRVAKSRTTEQLENGVSEFVQANPTVLAGVIGSLLTPDGFESMRLQQQKMYPRPKQKYQALRNMADAIELLLA